MILHISALLRELLPHESPVRPVTVARISTTTAVYLVFDGAATPRWVVRAGDAIKLHRAHQTLTLLHARAPDLVPRSITCARWREVECVHIQAGVIGQPWFRLQEFAPASRTVREIALAALSTLHEEIRREPAWVCSVEPASELQRVTSELGRQGSTAGTRRIVRKAQLAFERCGGTSSFLQHGDFCLNNLIVRKTDASVIDFDEFGTTAMPLHDEFSLALSLVDFSGDASCENFVSHLASCVSERVRREPWLLAALEALFVHHLLWRLAECGAVNNRQPRAGRFEAALEQADSDGTLLDRVRARVEASLAEASR